LEDDFFHLSDAMFKRSMNDDDQLMEVEKIAKKSRFRYRVTSWDPRKKANAEKLKR